MQPEKVEAVKAAKSEPEELDEEAMYSQSIKLTGEVKIENFGSEEPPARYDLSDTIFVFRDDEVLVNCMRNKNGWYVGDVDNSMRVPEHCHIAKVDTARHHSTLDGLISGGFLHNSVQQSAYGFAFNVENVNCVDTINCNINTFLPTMIVPRYMHQSAVVRGKTGYWTLLLVGGK